MKPEWGASESLSTVSAEAHLLSAALLCYCDDEGYFRANPELVRGGTIPLRVDSARIEVLLSELESIGYIQRAVGKDGRLYGRVVNFSDHQVINRPTPSRIRPLVKFTHPPLSSVSPHGALTVGKEGKGNGSGGEGNGDARATGTPEPPSPEKPTGAPVAAGAPADSMLGEYLDALRSGHPRFDNEFRVSRELFSVSNLLPPIAEFRATLAAWCASEQWKSDGGRYVPSAANWVKNGGWKNQPPPAAESKGGKAKTLFGSSSSTAAKTTKERANVRRIRLD